MNEITFIDMCKSEHEHYLKEVLGKIPCPSVTKIQGDSTSEEVFNQVKDKKFDVVMIDGAHEYPFVSRDIALYAPLATKYVFMHDIHIDGVNKALDAVRGGKYGKYHEITYEKPRFGYGIIEVGSEHDKI